METFTSAPPLGCTSNYGNRSTALVYIRATQRVPGYPVSYAFGYPGNELPSNGSRTCDWQSSSTSVRFSSVIAVTGRPLPFLRSVVRCPCDDTSQEPDWCFDNSASYLEIILQSEY